RTGHRAACAPRWYAGAREYWPRPGWSRRVLLLLVPVFLRVNEIGERAQVGQALPPFLAPCPFPQDGGGKTDPERLVECLVRVSQNAAEQRVDLGFRGRGQRQAAGQVDVTGPVEREVHSVHPGVALKKEPVELRVVLVGLAAEERLYLQTVLSDDQPGQRGELVLAREAHQVSARLGALIRKAETVQGSLNGIAGGGVVGCHDRYAPTRVATSSI